MVTTAAPSTTEPAAGQPRRYGLLVLILGVVAGLLVGYAAGILTFRPAAHPDDSSPEAGFARDMTTHHAQAVDMGMIALERAETAQVRNLGMDIGLVQQSEIGIMQQWLRNWGLLPTGTEPAMAWMPDGTETLVDGRMPGMATQDQMAALREAEGIEVDRLFVELMIDHHLGGIHMADGVLELSDHPDVRWVAEAMKQAQEKEIQVLQDLRSSLADA